MYERFIYLFIISVEECQKGRRTECEMYCRGGEYAHEWHECVFACEHRVWENCKSIPACAHGHFYNPFDGVCISLRVSLSSHVRMCTCLRLRAFWSAAPPRPLRMCPCMCACVLCVCVRVCVCVPGEPVVGQCISPDQGYLRGGDADDRQPLRLCLPPLLLSSAHLQRLQGPPARGTTLNTHEYKHVHSTHTGPRGGWNNLRSGHICKTNLTHVLIFQSNI